MAEDTKPVDFGRLRAVAIIALLAGIAVLLIALWQLNQFQDFQIGWAVLSAGLAAIAWGAVFYFGCLIVEGSLTDYIVSDDTEIKGERVEMVTKTRSSGDRRLDAWIGHFVFARNTFGMGILPVLILIALYIWG